MQALIPVKETFGLADDKTGATSWPMVGIISSCIYLRLGLGAAKMGVKSFPASQQNSSAKPCIDSFFTPFVR
jgi:hypothetical protein